MGIGTVDVYYRGKITLLSVFPRMRDDVFIPYTLVFVCGADLVPRAVDDLAEGTLAHGVLPLEVELVGGAVIVLATVHAEVDCVEVRVWAFDRD